MIRHPLFPALSVVLSAACWGAFWIPMRDVAGLGIGAGWTAALVNLPALTLALLLAARHGGIRQAADGRLLAAGFFFGAGFSCYALALVHSEVVRATLLFYFTPIWGTLLSMLVLGERPGPRRWIAIALSLPGLALVLGAGASALQVRFGIGEALGLASGAAWAIGAVLHRQANGFPVPALALVQYGAMVGISITLATLLGETAPDMDLFGAAMKPAIILYSSLILGTFYVINWAIARMSPGRSGLLMMSEVIVAVGTAALLLPEETMSAPEWLGAALIVAAGAIEVSGEPA